MNRLISSTLLVFVLAVCANAAVRTVNVGKFDALTLCSYVNVVFKQQEGNSSVTIEGKSNELVEDVAVEEKNGTLIIDTKNEKWKNEGNYNSKREEVTVTVVSPQISNVKLNGSGNFTADKIAATDLNLKLNGSGNISVTAVDAQSAVMKLNGSGAMYIGSLKSTNAFAKLNGSGDFYVGSIDASSANVKLNGSGDLNVGAVKAVNAEMKNNGAGNISVGECDANAVTVIVNSSGDSKIGNITATNVAAHLKGSGDITLTGKADTADLELEQSGKLDAGKMVCRVVEAAVEGTGSIYCHASESVKADASGDGNIYVEGNPGHAEGKNIKMLNEK